MGRMTESLSTSLRDRRRAAGLSQRELAARSGVPQPNIAAYETGRRTPSAVVVDRLDAVLRVPSLERVRGMREAILAAASARRLENVRVFGSVARGEASADSDVDLLVHPLPDASILDLAAFCAELDEVLGMRTDVVSDRGTGPTMEHIRSEAVPL